eukprot:4440492-Alexandrium_andersonii.AAC.1
MCNSAPPHMQQKNAAHAQPPSPGGGHGDRRNDLIGKDSEAIVSGGICAMVPVAAARTRGLCMCSIFLLHVRWGGIVHAVARLHVRSAAQWGLSRGPKSSSR